MSQKPRKKDMAAMREEREGEWRVLHYGCARVWRREQRNIEYIFNVCIFAFASGPLALAVKLLCLVLLFLYIPPYIRPYGLT